MAQTREEIEWIGVEESSPELTESVKVIYLNDFVVVSQSEEVGVAEKKGDSYEEGVGRFTEDGWYSNNCDNVTHWHRK